MTLFNLSMSLTGILHSTYSMKTLLKSVNPYEYPVYQTNILVLGSLQSLFWSTLLYNIWSRNRFYLCYKSATFATWLSLVNEDSNLWSYKKSRFLSSHKLSLAVLDMPSDFQGRYKSLQQLKNPSMRRLLNKALARALYLFHCRWLARWGNGKKDPSKQGGQFLGQRLQQQTIQ